MVDLLGLHRELHRALVVPGASPFDRGLTAARILDSLDPIDRATLATHLVHNLTDTQLGVVGRAGLRAMRRAALIDERGEHAVARLDAALRQQPAITARCVERGIWVLATGAKHQPHFSARADSVVILVSVGERKTGKAQLCEHYRQCHDELPDGCLAALCRAIELGRVQWVHTGGVGLWAKLRSLAVRAPAWAGA